MLFLFIALELIYVCQWGPVSAGELRPGDATETHSCNHVRSVPEELFRMSNEVWRPNGLNRTFYKKYTEAYGIPILGSHVVSDDALKRACYVVRFMLADHSGVRKTFYKLGGRVAIMAKTQQTLDIPEHSHMDPWWNQRARGLGGSIHAPLTTGAEENLLCLSNDRYHKEDIFLHEFSHAIDLMGATIRIAIWHDQKMAAYHHANTTRKLLNIYSGTTAEEYIAEGIQTYFEVNVGDTASVPNGIVNDVDTRAQLQTYDRVLYTMLHGLFPCGNTFLKRCESTREKENSQHLRLNCNQRDKDFITYNNVPSCPDKNPTECIEKAANGDCHKPLNSPYMLNYCKASCHSCSHTDNCPDKHPYCPEWAKTGNCHTDSGYMLPNCQHSCNSCQGHPVG